MIWLRPYHLPCVILFASVYAASSAAHEGPDHKHPHGKHQHDHDHAEEEAQQAEPLPPALVLPQLEGPRPWSDKPVLNDPSRFQIAIMTDRTGGHRPGIWMKAVERINWLRPEFVMSVGDLIEGYSDDREKVNAEWKEFLGFIDQMQMRFFFVAGNHDVTNPIMHKLWREHFGPEWYSFDYKGVHFVCLSSEDPSTQIGDEQLQWVAGDLEKHRDARWTLVFLHKPLWRESDRAAQAGNADRTNWGKVEKLLGARPHTVFAGHVHHYVQYDRRGMKYYHLGTTGGGSRLRGEAYGEFDHITWLTMEPDGPHVAHLLLDGILSADAVTEKGIAHFRDFLAKTSLEVAPILVSDEEGFSQGQIEMRLANDFDTPVEIAGQIRGLPLRGLTVDPVTLRLAAKGGETSQLAVRIQFAERIAFRHLSQTVLTAKVRTLGEDKPLSAEVTVPVIIDRGHPCPRLDEPMVVDGRIDDSFTLPLATTDDPLLLGNASEWNGPGDCSLRYGLAHDEKFVYLAARIKDDRVLADGDGVELRLDARPVRTRSADSRQMTGTYRWRVAAPAEKVNEKVEVSGYRNARTWEGSQAAARRTEDGYDVELAMPLEFLTANQGADWDSFQFTVVVDDRDDTSDKGCRVVWRGTGDVDSRNTNYGHFVRSAGTR